MGTLNIHEEARRRADAEALPPKHDPVQAGIAGAAIVGFAIAVFCGIARIDTDAVAPSIAITTGLGFAGPFFLYRSEAKKNQAVYAREYMRLSEQEKAVSGSPEKSR